MNEARDIWPKQQLISLISISTGIEDTQPPSMQQSSFMSSLTQVLFGLAKVESPDSTLSKWAFELSRISESIHKEVTSKWEMYAEEG